MDCQSGVKLSGIVMLGVQSPTTTVLNVGDMHQRGAVPPKSKVLLNINVHLRSSLAHSESKDADTYSTDWP